jgi:ABC-type phosphate/phosphonate transport system substrate-binding protein
MYPFDALRAAYDRLWAAVASRLVWAPRQLTWHDDVHESWTSPDLVVGYTCGWPLVTRLTDVVQVVGAFEFDIPGADGPTYRSVVVARADVVGDGAVTDLGRFAGMTAAVNGPDSLSGWVSLLAAVHGPGATWSGPVRWTGAHVESVRALHDGAADVASIDAVTWAHLGRFLPELTDGLVVVGAGPRVPCLPVVAGRAVSDERVDELRAAMSAAVAELADVRSELLVRRFVPMTLADYLPLRSLAPGG